MTTKPDIIQMIIATGVLAILSNGAFGAIGAISLYEYLVIEDVEDHKFQRLWSYAFIGFAIGLGAHYAMVWKLGESIPALVFLSGLLSQKIIQAIISVGLADVLKVFGVKLENK